MEREVIVTRVVGLQRTEINHFTHLIWVEEPNDPKNKTYFVYLRQGNYIPSLGQRVMLGEKEETRRSKWYIRRLEEK